MENGENTLIFESNSKKEFRLLRKRPSFRYLTLYRIDSMFAIDRFYTMI
ncbi:hypothetical protein bsdcttw_42880 [Anaerocolumna chitinilytica]|uniref:Uncharacterized protein n=1 Tax=Anaerocolumna chitinilytica TaxID=1727145 RepID=A0A7M3S9I0_9FIRM|nr:hypothetical protein bsdcttw_42880 [Anaerocolumna chitinilytica]